MSIDLSRFSINQITTPKWSMPEAIDGYKKQGISGIAVWRQFLEAYGVKNTKKHLQDAGMWVPSLCTSEWLNVSVNESLDQAISVNKRLLDDAAEIGATCLMMVVGGLPTDSKDIDGQRERVREALHALLPHARSVGVKLGLEPLHPMYAGDRSVLNSIKVANDLCDELGEGTGLVPDVYHCWWDPEFRNELRRAGPEKILTFHYCDWLVPTRNLRDRGMVGDGVIDIARVKSWLDEMNYTGPFELEIFSELDWWQRDPEETVRIAIERCAPHVKPIEVSK